MSDGSEENLIHWRAESATKQLNIHFESSFTSLRACNFVWPYLRWNSIELNGKREWQTRAFKTQNKFKYYHKITRRAWMCNFKLTSRAFLPFHTFLLIAPLLWCFLCHFLEHTHISDGSCAREWKEENIFTLTFLCEIYSKAIGGETTFAFNGSFIWCANWMAASLKIFMRFLPFLRRALNWLARIASEYYSAQIHFFPSCLTLAIFADFLRAPHTQQHLTICQITENQKNDRASK